MRRIFSAMLLGMFAFGFCVGCGEDTTLNPPSTDADQTGDAEGQPAAGSGEGEGEGEEKKAE